MSMKSSVAKGIVPCPGKSASSTMIGSAAPAPSSTARLLTRGRSARNQVAAASARNAPASGLASAAATASGTARAARGVASRRAARAAPASHRADTGRAPPRPGRSCRPQTAPSRRACPRAPKRGVIGGRKPQAATVAHTGIFSRGDPGASWRRSERRRANSQASVAGYQSNPKARASYLSEEVRYGRSPASNRPRSHA